MNGRLVNQSSYKKLENGWSNALKAGKEVYVKVSPMYNGNSSRPSKFLVESTVDGVTSRRFLENPEGVD